MVLNFCMLLTAGTTDSGNLRWIYLDPHLPTIYVKPHWRKTSVRREIHLDINLANDEVFVFRLRVPSKRRKSYVAQSLS